MSDELVCAPASVHPAFTLVHDALCHLVATHERQSAVCLCTRNEEVAKHLVDGVRSIVRPCNDCRLRHRRRVADGWHLRRRHLWR